MSWLADTQPVLVKELRGRMRGARAFVVLSLYLLVLGGFAVLLYLAVRSSVNSDPFTAGRIIGKTLFIGIAAVALIQVMIIVPAQAAAAISGERESETFDLLIVTLLPAWKIVLGKLLAALAYAVMLIVAVVPFMALAFFFGGVTLGEVAIALIGLLVTALLYGAIGILWSVISARTITATVMAQATNLLFLLGLPFLMYVFSSIFLFRGPMSIPAWAVNYPFVYAADALVALHPFIALGATEIFISNGNSGLIAPFHWGPNGQQFWIPAPWLSYTIEGTILAMILIVIAIRSLRPNEPRPGRARRGPPKRQPVELQPVRES
jgi:ABC-type transport system involved in multi-copper enzyme maturation permease subunit